MNHKFKPGQKLVCIKDTIPKNEFWKGSIIKEGDIVTVKDIVDSSIDGNPIIDFIEHPAQQSDFLVKCYYSPSYFAPLIEADQFVEVAFEKVIKHSPVGAN